MRVRTTSPRLRPRYAFRTSSIEAPMGKGQRLHVRVRTLASGLSGPIHIDDEPLPPCPVPQASNRVGRGPRDQILLKECPQRFHRRLIKGGKKAREG